MIPRALTFTDSTDRAGIVAKYRKLTDADDYEAPHLNLVVQPPDVEAAIASILRDGTDGTLFGPPGIGKTYLLRAIEHELYWHEKPALYIKERDLATHPLHRERVDKYAKSEWRDEEWIVTEGLVDVPVLLLDDFGEKTKTPSDHALVSRIIDERWEANRRTIFATNLDVAGFAERLGPSSFDRVHGPAVKFDGTSRRHGAFTEPDTDYVDELDIEVALRVIGDDGALWLRWVNELAEAGLYEAIGESPPMTSVDGAFARVVRDVFGEVNP